MVNTFRGHLLADPDQWVNLDDLLTQMTTRLAILLILLSGLAMWLLLPRNPFPLLAFSYLGCVLGLGIVVIKLGVSHPILARHTLIWGLVAIWLGAMLSFTQSWLPLLGTPIILIGAVLVVRSEVAIATIMVGASIGLVMVADRDYDLLLILFVYIMNVTIMWLVIKTLYTTLQWIRNAQQRADHLLALVRDHRADLSQALKTSDVTNSLLKRTQDELIAARRRADETRQMKEQFAINVSHELRTPLNLILGFSEIMYLSPEVYGNIHWPVALRRDVHQIYHSSRHLLELVDDILDLSRFEMTGFALYKEPTELGMLLQQVAQVAGDLFRGRAVQLAVDISPNLPSLTIDQTRIRQVLFNLINNAQRFTQVGMVQLTARQIKNEIIIRVQDTGSGIPADKMAYLFDEFFQVDQSLRRDYQGIGLGLAISKRFVHAHGGRIWAESQPGSGSTFSFSLPVLPTYLADFPPADQDGLPKPKSKQKRQLIVIDPDPAVIDLIGRHLTAFEIIQIKDCNQVMAAIAQLHPYAIIYNAPPDEPLPTSLKAIRQVPVIELSLPSQAWTTNALAVTGSLAKPIRAKQLVQAIELVGGVQDILVIDDDRGFCQLVTRILAATNGRYRIRRAYDGHEGLDAMRIQRPDLVLLDLIMPEMDGFQVLEVMRQDPNLNHLPVLLLTATNYAEDVLSQRCSKLSVFRSDGLRSSELLACLHCMIEHIEPHYDEKTIPTPSET